MIIDGAIKNAMEHGKYSYDYDQTFANYSNVHIK